MGIASALATVSACEGPRAETPAAGGTRVSAYDSHGPRYVPQDVPEDRAPPEPPPGPTAADTDVASIDRSLDVVRARIAALPKNDSGVPLANTATSCLEDLRAQIATARRSAEERRDSLRAAEKRGDGELVKHDLAIVRVLADRAKQLAAESDSCH